MKELNRTQKTKLVERTKTAMLVLLFSSCLFLGYRILDIYHGQTASNSNWWGSYSPVATGLYDDAGARKEQNIFETVWSPEFIMICDGDSRSAILNGTDDFIQASAAANDLLRKVFYIVEEEGILQTDDTELKNSFKSNSIYLRYPAERFTAYDEMLYGTADSKLSKIINSYFDMAISFDKNNQNKATVFIPDKEGKAVAKAVVEAESVKELLDTFENNKTNSKSHVFAYELNLDSKNGNKPSLNSRVVVPLEDIEANDIIIDTPKAYKAGVNFTKTTEFMAGLINIFGYNPNTVRQYVNSDDALIFVGETGSLSIEPEGRIEYKALDSNDGILLNDPGSTDLFAINSGMYEMIEKIFKICGINVDNSGFEIKISQLAKYESQNEKFEMMYDYFVDGKKIRFSNFPAICAKIERGMMTEIKMQIIDIEKLGTKTTVPGIFEAIDAFCLDKQNVAEIDDARLEYKYTENGGEISAEWSIQGD